MGDSLDGSETAQDASDPSDSIGQRGFFGRIFGAFSSNDQDDTAPQDGARNGFAGAPQQPPLGIGNLRKMRVEDVAIPKPDIIAVPVNATLEELVTQFRDSGFSRLPVFKGTLDNPLGLIHLKDLALQQAFSDPKPRFNLRKMLRPLLYAPPSMPIGVLLQKMQTERTHMALVIDEYGGVDGLATIEDLIETVIGEIEDEHDTSEDSLWREEKPGQYIVQSRAPLSEFEAEVGMRLSTVEEEDEFDSLGGLVSMRAGRVPARGEVILGDAGVEFEIVDADPRRIKRIRVRLPHSARSAAVPPEAARHES